ncbi:hypothetical protein N3K66_003637 [Trichothecium roseum]|uniref:Uncharacterized protein n=1 Tax=Trichothecium roseum TaxID=47278 RepID=A0ACC0V7E7_9HYPO|nr:hypothetical protein N3K66_003637 [Trichothecium roseum]
MATTQPSNNQRRPRLSLQIKTSVGPSTKSTRSLATIDPKDPTALNTLSNIYATAIGRSAPHNSEPLTAINTLQSFSLATPVEYSDLKKRVVTPHVANCPETPSSAHAMSPRPLDKRFPSTMTATPPLSGTRDANDSSVFTFSPADTGMRAPSESISTTPIEAKYQRRRLPQMQLAANSQPLPYTHPRSLHSILRNSPLPPRTAIPPPSPRRQSLRLQEKAARKVGYCSPIEQEIITNKYVRSHIDLLAEDASPCSPSPVTTRQETVLDTALAFTASELQDGGQTPGPFEEMRRRVAGQSLNSPSSPSGIRKRKKKEKKRRWVWTIGQDEDEEDEARTPMGPVASAPQLDVMCVDETPTPSVESSDAWSEGRDVDMSDVSSVVSDQEGPSPCDGEIDLKTPTAPKRLEMPLKKSDTPIPPELASNRGTPVPMPPGSGERDTPVPPEGL